MKWADIPVVVKAGVACIVATMAFVGYMSTYQTDAEAGQYREQHGQELQRVRIQQVEDRIAEYEYRLLSQNLNPQEREWLQRQIKKLEAQKECIRNGKC